MGDHIKTIKSVLFITLPTLVIMLLILEVVFRIVIPASDPPWSIYNEMDKIYNFRNDKKDGIYTIGRFSEIRSKWRINNMGWNYPIDYYPVEDKKLIAVIGDSYIEAFQVNVDENYPYILRGKLKNIDYEVYAFGKSGAALSQYLHMSRYIKKYLKPDILIFNIVHNDFYESIFELSPERPFFLQVSNNGDGSISETTPTAPRLKDHSPPYNFIKAIISKSAVYRYLIFNLKVREIYNNYNIGNIREKYEANINVSNTKKNNKLIYNATNYIVKKIREENKDKRILFIFDGLRSAIYDNSLNDSKVLWIGKMMETICNKNDIELINLTSLMDQDYRVHKKKFNSEFDFHWNQYGHEFVANVLFEYLLSNKIRKE